MTIMAHSDPLLPRAWAQSVKCHYGYPQVEDINLGRPPLPIFHSSKKKKEITILSIKKFSIARYLCVWV